MKNVQFVAFALFTSMFCNSQKLSASTKGPFWIEKDPASKRTAKIKADLFNELTVGLAKDLSAAVVTVLTTSEVSAPQMIGPDEMMEFFFGLQGGGPRRQLPPRSRKAQSLGSGFVVHPDGIIITNSHVVRLEGERIADTVRVKFLGDSTKSEGVEVEVVGIDPLVDTAVLKLKKPSSQKLTVAPLGNSDDLKVGENVLAIGNPHGLSHSVSKGIVSALARDVLPEVSADFIQTDASINQGNSGGPLVNLSGEVVGVNTAIDPRGQGLGFAIPINSVKRVVRDILDKGHASHGYAGVTLFPNFDAEVAKSLGLKSSDGALIEDVMPGEPADKAGLKAYDVIVKVGERKISTNTDFQKAVRDLSPGTSVKLGFYRQTKFMESTLTLGDLDKGLNKVASGLSKSRKGLGSNSSQRSSFLAKTGLGLEELSPELRMKWELSPNVQGLVVSEVTNKSPADKAGLVRGDILLEIKQQKISRISDAEKLLSSKGSHLLKILRGNSVALFSLKI